MNRIAVLLASLCLSFAPAAFAQQSDGTDSLGTDWSPQQDEARAAVQAGRHVPLAQVIEAIRKRTPGRQLDAGIENEGGKPVYRVRWTTEKGRRIDYIVDARTGRILRADGG